MTPPFSVRLSAWFGRLARQLTDQHSPALRRISEGATTWQGKPLLVRYRYSQ